MRASHDTDALQRSRSARSEGQHRRDDIAAAPLPNLEALRKFVVVAEELSFTRAAQRLHVVQSGVSTGVSALERELGTPLFYRDRHSVALTEAGRVLLPEARATLAAALAATDAVAEAAAGLRGVLSIGTMISTGAIDVPSLVGRFHQAHPGVLVRLRVLPSGTADLASAVADGALDLALLSLSGQPPDGVAVRQLAQEPLVLICAPEHPLASVSRGRADGADGAAGVPLSAVAGETFIDFPGGWGSRAVVDRAFTAAGIDRQVAFEVTDYATVAALVGSGLGVAMMPESAVARLPGVVSIAVAATLTWRIQVATAAGRRPGAAARAFLRELLRGR